MSYVRTITAANRAEILRTIDQAPLFSRVTLNGPRRTIEQNALMWVLLSCFSEQVQHCGHYYSPEVWKCVMMHALGKELQFVPSLDGDEIVAIGYRSSELSKEEMSDLLELLFSEGAKRGVNFETAARPGEAKQGVARLGLAKRGEARTGEA